MLAQLPQILEKRSRGYNHDLFLSFLRAKPDLDHFLAYQAEAIHMFDELSLLALLELAILEHLIRQLQDLLKREWLDMGMLFEFFYLVFHNAL